MYIDIKTKSVDFYKTDDTEIVKGNQYSAIGNGEVINVVKVTDIVLRLEDADGKELLESDIALSDVFVDFESISESQDAATKRTNIQGFVKTFAEYDGFSPIKETETPQQNETMTNAMKTLLDLQTKSELSENAANMLGQQLIEQRMESLQSQQQQSLLGVQLAQESIARSQSEQLTQMLGEQLAQEKIARSQSEQLNQMLGSQLADIKIQLLNMQGGQENV
ncbi:hypothetical protein [Niallia sp. 03190]|uniref:hypothetical protein n=1 Tax=Niallia sp. 03190 TaxID=3458061 RepID=UPI004043F87D